MEKIDVILLILRVFLNSGRKKWSLCLAKGPNALQFRTPKDRNAKFAGVHSKISKPWGSTRESNTRRKRWAKKIDRRTNLFFRKTINETYSTLFTLH